MIINKSKTPTGFIAFVCVVLAIFIHGYIFYRGGFTSDAIELNLYILPFSLLFILFAVSIIRSSKNKLALNDHGLLVEDFSSSIIPWKVINVATLKTQILPRGSVCQWLVLRTQNDTDYSNNKILKLNKVIGIDGIPVCNLASYECDTKAVVELINRYATHA